MAYKTGVGAAGSYLAAFPISADHTTVTATAAIELEANVKVDIGDTSFTADSIKVDNDYWDFCNQYSNTIVTTAAAGEAPSETLDDGTAVTGDRKSVV